MALTTHSKQVVMAVVLGVLIRGDVVTRYRQFGALHSTLTARPVITAVYLVSDRVPFKSTETTLGVGRPVSIEIIIRASGILTHNLMRTFL